MLQRHWTIAILVTIILAAFQLTVVAFSLTPRHKLTNTNINTNTKPLLKKCSFSLWRLQATMSSDSPSQTQAADNLDLNSKSIFCVNVNLFVKPERRDEFIRVITANQKGTLETEPLAKLYVWGASTTDPNTFHFQEQYYNGKQGFEAHTSSPHFAVWMAFADSSPFTKDPEVMLFEINNE